MSNEKVEVSFTVTCNNCKSIDVDISSGECGDCGSYHDLECNNCGAFKDGHKGRDTPGRKI